ncbi:MAG: MFS transporter [Actinomycetota bacterium]|nr:MFS transporter [Actinomycetota bacterium]
MPVAVMPVRSGTVLAAFTGYGLLWGPYLALLPDIRRATGADEALLGTALLIGALAALPAMAWVGRLLDRLGRPVAMSAMATFAVVAAAPSLAASVPTLIVTVAMFGFCSGACNVVVVALAVESEAGTGGRVMNRAHGLFCVGVLVGSLSTGALVAFGVSGRLVALVGSAAVAIGVFALRDALPSRFGERVHRTRVKVRLDRTAALLCLLGALAMMVESGVQQWSAVFLADVLGAPAGLSAAAPGIFAGAMALGRFGGHWLSCRVSERVVLVSAGALSGVGVLILSTGASIPVGLLGTAIVGGAISLATPTVYALVGSRAAQAERGAAIGMSASLAGVGLLIGPAVVGQLASWTDLRSALMSLSLISVLVCLLALRVSAGPRLPT